jgi:hypothetical protein
MLRRASLINADMRELQAERRRSIRRRDKIGKNNVKKMKYESPTVLAGLLYPGKGIN